MRDVRRGWIDALRRAVGDEHVLTDPADTQAYSTDWTSRFHGATPAVVRPATTAEVADVIAIARHHHLAVVPQGGNTGLVGGGVPLAGELVVSLRRMHAIEPVDVAARQVTAGAGATVGAVQRAAAAAGLAYAVDFGARDSATIGGTVATNAGGINLLRHGGTREQLVGVEAVLGTGAVISHLHGLVKDNTGYHLPGLLCGSEGTLGIVTACRLRLVERHDQRVTALVGFASVDAALAAVVRWRRAIESLEAAELFLDAGLRLVCEAFDLARPLQPAPAYVLIEAAAHVDPTEPVAEAVATTPGVVDAAVATDAARRHALWRYREEHTLAINTLGPPHKLDVTLPADRLAEFVTHVTARIEAVRPGLRTWLFGHAGDGNIHVNVTGAHHDGHPGRGPGPEHADGHDDAGEAIDEAVLRYVAELGGSISAEHGIGTAKQRWLHLSRSAAEIAAMRSIKLALDPDAILNPNCLLPPLR